MDYADGGDLAGKLKEQKDKAQSGGGTQYFSEDAILNWFT